MKELIKQEILTLLKENDNYSFSEIVSNLEYRGIKVYGDRSLFLCENLVVWDGISSEFATAIRELIESKKIILLPLGEINAFLIYSNGGQILELPIAKRITEYVTPHWLPTIIKEKL